MRWMVFVLGFAIGFFVSGSQLVLSKVEKSYQDVLPEGIYVLLQEDGTKTGNDKLQKEIDELKAQISELKKEVEEQKKVNSDTKDEITKMNVLIETLTKKKELLFTKCKDIENLLDTFQKDNQKLKEVISTLQKEKETMRGILTALGDDVAKLKNDVNVSKSNELEITRKAEALKKNIDDVNMDLVKLRERFEQFYPPTLVPMILDTFPVPKLPIKGDVLFVNQKDNRVIVRPGKKEGVKVGYRFKVFHDKKDVATLSIITVEFADKDERFSIAKVIDGRIDLIRDGDPIEAILQQNPLRLLHIKSNDDKGITIDGGLRVGVKVGQRYLIQKGDKRGILIVKESFDDFSTAEIGGDLKKEDIKIGDVVQLEK